MTNQYVEKIKRDRERRKRDREDLQTLRDFMREHHLTVAQVCLLAQKALKNETQHTN